MPVKRGRIYRIFAISAYFQVCLTSTAGPVDTSRHYESLGRGAQKLGTILLICDLRSVWKMNPHPHRPHPGQSIPHVQLSYEPAAEVRASMAVGFFLPPLFSYPTRRRVRKPKDEGCTRRARWRVGLFWIFSRTVVKLTGTGTGRNGSYQEK